MVKHFRAVSTSSVPLLEGLLSPSSSVLLLQAISESTVSSIKYLKVVRVRVREKEWLLRD
jgi:hypothetical protein